MRHEKKNAEQSSHSHKSQIHGRRSQGRKISPHLKFLLSFFCVEIVKARSLTRALYISVPWQFKMSSGIVARHKSHSLLNSNLHTALALPPLRVLHTHPFALQQRFFVSRWYPHTPKSIEFKSDNELTNRSIVHLVHSVLCVSFRTQVAAIQYRKLPKFLSRGAMDGSVPTFDIEQKEHYKCSLPQGMAAPVIVGGIGDSGTRG